MDSLFRMRNFQLQPHFQYTMTFGQQKTLVAKHEDFPFAAELF